MSDRKVPAFESQRKDDAVWSLESVSETWMAQNEPELQAATDELREQPGDPVRFQIIGNACIKNIGKSQSCMVSKLPYRLYGNAPVCILSAHEYAPDCCMYLTSSHGTRTTGLGTWLMQASKM